MPRLLKTTVFFFSDKTDSRNHNVFLFNSFATKFCERAVEEHAEQWSIFVKRIFDLA